MFLSKVTTSMITARRAVPTPTDFEYALQQMGLTTSSLEPHLRPPIPRDRLMIQLEPPSPTKAMTTSIEKLIGKDLSGELDKASRTYIPKHLPPFPSRHTYKWTEKDPIRETDARKIREEAAHQARQGEEALRRLIAVSKVGSEKDVRQLAEKDKRSKKRHQLWEQAVAEASNVPNARLTSVEKSRTQSKMVERSVVVNASSMYHRKGITGKRKGVPQLPPELLGS
jgi:transcription initiation factor TFIID subunit 8